MISIANHSVVCVSFVTIFTNADIIKIISKVVEPPITLIDNILYQSNLSMNKHVVYIDDNYPSAKYSTYDIKQVSVQAA